MKIKIDDSIWDKRELVPEYATEGSAGMDLKANIKDSVVIRPGEKVVIDTGVMVEIPLGFVGIIAVRSSMGFKFNVTLANSIGVIDSDYRGKVMCALVNHSDVEREIQPLERICQLMIIPIWQVSLEIVDDLDETARGSGGFGSTGRI